MTVKYLAKESTKSKILTIFFESNNRKDSTNVYKQRYPKCQQNDSNLHPGKDGYKLFLLEAKGLGRWNSYSSFDHVLYPLKRYEGYHFNDKDVLSPFHPCLLFANGIVFQNSMSYYEYLKAKYLKNNEIMNSIRDQNGYSCDPIDKTLMDSEWQSKKSREAMTKVVKLRKNLYLPHEEN